MVRWRLATAPFLQDQSFMPIIHFIFFLAVLLVPLMAEERDASLSIDTLVEQTLAENPEIRFYLGEVLAAKAGRQSAAKFANPELNLDVGRKTARSSDASASGVAWAAALAQPIEWPGRIGLRKAIANRDIALAELGLAQFKTALAARVQVLAYNLAAQQERAAAAAEVQDRLTALKDVIIQRDPAGIAPLLETKVIEATAVVVQKQAGDAAIEMQKALLELNQLRGRRADTPLKVQRTEFVFPEYPSLEQLLAEAASNNYELRVRVREFEQQGLKVALAKNERYPSFSVGPTVSREHASEKETVAALSFSVALPLWNTGNAQVQAAEARRLQAEASLRAAHRDVERQLTESRLIYESYRKRLVIWKSDVLKSFGDAAALADRHYRLGAVEIATYVELQEKYLEAIEAVSETKAKALEAAMNVERLTGRTESLVTKAEAHSSAENGKESAKVK
jgi:cobalt-zinc-cadmium efflux system outer membrane protein